jgi:hypothetical protein
VAPVVLVVLVVLRRAVTVVLAVTAVLVSQVVLVVLVVLRRAVTVVQVVWAVPQLSLEQLQQQPVVPEE